MRRFFYYVCFVVITALSLIGRPCRAQTSSYGELQAAYLYNFAKYVIWPDHAQQFVIGVFRDAEIAEGLEVMLKGKKVGGIPIVLRKVTTPEELLQCQIVYLSGPNSRELNFLTSTLARKSVLIVTEEDLARKGATISFVVEDDNLRFKLNEKALRQAGLEASEGLLRLAIRL